MQISEAAVTLGLAKNGSTLCNNNHDNWLPCCCYGYKQHNARVVSMVTTDKTFAICFHGYQWSNAWIVAMDTNSSWLAICPWIALGMSIGTNNKIRVRLPRIPTKAIRVLPCIWTAKKVSLVAMDINSLDTCIVANNIIERCVTMDTN